MRRRSFPTSVSRYIVVAYVLAETRTQAFDCVYTRFAFVRLTRRRLLSSFKMSPIAIAGLRLIPRLYVQTPHDFADMLFKHPQLFSWQELTVASLRMQQEHLCRIGCGRFANGPRFRTCCGPCTAGRLDAHTRECNDRQQFGIWVIAVLVSAVSAVLCFR